jgi:iron complex transport system ATP-binding protein
MGMTLVRAVDLSYVVDDAVLVDGATLEVAAGEVVGVIGPNGAGKSTLLRLLAGELEPASGTIAIEGRDLAELPLLERARLRALLPQQHVLEFGFRCIDVVLMGRFPHRESEAEAHAAARAAMEAMDAWHLAERTFPTLSGGEQARVACARVLAQETPLLLLDEPTANLDLRHQQTVMEVVRMRAGAGVGVVAVLHDINLAARHADRVAIMDDSRLRAVGTPEEVLTPSLLSQVYEIEVAVVPDPRNGQPLILPGSRSS